MTFTVAVSVNKHYRDRHGEHVRHDVVEIGIKNVPPVRYVQLYRLDGGVTRDEAELIASRLLIDPVTDTYALDGAEESASHSIEVWLRHGVTDTVAESVLKAVRDLGITKELKVKTGQKYEFRGAISPATLKQVAERLLVNPMIQEYKVQ